jgi:hypothetical protein
MVVRTAGAGLRRLADVAVMQATDFGDLHDPARLGELDGPDVRRILVEREMRASPVIVREVADQDAAQVAFAENQNVSQTLAPDRADEPLNAWMTEPCVAALPAPPPSLRVKRRAGSGQPTPFLVVMTADAYGRLMAAAPVREAA